MKPNTQSMTREYLERTRSLQPIISADTALLERVLGTFKSAYEDQELPDEVLLLGEGTQHKVYHVGKIRNPATEQDLYLALRLTKNDLFTIPQEIQPSLLLETIGAYEGAHIQGHNVPYFTAIVTTALWDEPLRHAGILTEDLTMGKQRELKPEHPHLECEFFLRDEPDGTKTRFFVDPSGFTQLPRVNTGHYMSSDALIHIRR